MLKLNSCAPVGKRGTLYNVQLMMNFLPAERWHIVMKPAETGNIGDGVTRLYCRDGFKRSHLYLRGQNKEDNHILGRPDETKHILVDDLTREALNHLYSDGLTPNLIVETSPDNYQAWLTVSYEDNPPSQLATAIAKKLALRYEGDEGAANAHQLGRIPGYRNRKPKYCSPDGGYPIAQVVYKRKGIAPGMEDIVQEICQETIKQKNASFSECFMNGLTRNHIEEFMSEENIMKMEDACQIYAEIYDVLYSRSKYFQNVADIQDRSRIDFHIALHMLAVGFDFEEVTLVLMAGSSKAVARGWQYVNTTTCNAYKILEKRNAQRRTDRERNSTAVHA